MCLDIYESISQTHRSLTDIYIKGEEEPVFKAPHHP